MTGLEVFDRVAYGHTVFHRDTDAWDLIDPDGYVAAVLCPRIRFLAVSLPKERVRPVAAGKRIPYGETVAFRIDDSNLEEGIARVAVLAGGA